MNWNFHMCAILTDIPGKHPIKSAKKKYFKNGKWCKNLFCFLYKSSWIFEFNFFSLKKKEKKKGMHWWGKEKSTEDLNDCLLYNFLTRHM